MVVIYSEVRLMTSYMQTEVLMIKSVQQFPTSEVRNQNLLWVTVIIFPNSANPNRLLQVHFMKICSTVYRLFLSQSIGLLLSDLHYWTMLFPWDANISPGWRQWVRDSNPIHSWIRLLSSTYSTVPCIRAIDVQDLLKKEAIFPTFVKWE